MINRITTLSLTLSACLMFCSPTQEKQGFNEKEMRITSARAIDLISKKNYIGFKELFALEISKDIPDKNMNDLVDQINSFLARKEFPDKENIAFETSEPENKNEPFATNHIIYKFDNPSHSLHSYPRAITFSFLEKYGSSKLSGVHLTDDGN